MFASSLTLTLIHVTTIKLKKLNYSRCLPMRKAVVPHLPTAFIRKSLIILLETSLKLLKVEFYDLLFCFSTY